MTEYAICFDFPDKDHPVFAIRLVSANALKRGLSYTENLSEATLFSSYDDADLTLARYGMNVSPHGAVVEVGT